MRARPRRPEGGDDAPGVIYAWPRAALEADPEIGLITPGAQAGLRRLAAQEAVFAALADPDGRLDLHESVTEIVFPQGRTGPPAPEGIDPGPAPSPLERILAAHVGGGSLEAGAEPDPRIMFGRRLPSLREGWAALDAAWTAPAASSPARAAQISVAEALAEIASERDLRDPDAASALRSALGAWAARRAPRHRGGGEPTEWVFDLDGVAEERRKALSASLNAFTAALSGFPIEARLWTEAVASALTLAIGSLGDPTRLQASFASAFGVPSPLEAAELGEPARVALVSEIGLSHAYDRALLARLTPYHARRFEDDPTRVLGHLRRPGLCFSFASFIDLFFREIGPSAAIAAAARAVERATPELAEAFPRNPALVVSLTPPSAEPVDGPGASEAIRIFADMTADEASFEARSALTAQLIAAEAGDPAAEAGFVATFPDLETGATPAKAPVRALIEHGALAVMRRSTAGADGQPPDPRAVAPGWGGFELFAFFKGAIGAEGRVDPAEAARLSSEYDALLEQSRGVAEMYWDQVRSAV